jgi:ATP-dependent DNA ligase
MQEWSKELQLSEFDPYRHYSEDILHIQFLPQVEITGYDNMKKLHDSYVAEGWEGLVIRLASSTYKPGARGNDWIKIKCYFDDTYKVIGYELGLRGSEDMVFICEMKDGKTFKASPMGSREIKQEYVDNFEEKYKNQLGDCKYFEISPYGIPQQPKFIAFRWDLN